MSATFPLTNLGSTLSQMDILQLSLTLQLFTNWEKPRLCNFLETWL